MQTLIEKMAEGLSEIAKSASLGDMEAVVAGVEKATEIIKNAQTELEKTKQDEQVTEIAKCQEAIKKFSEIFAEKSEIEKSFTEFEKKFDEKFSEKITKMFEDFKSGIVLPSKQNENTQEIQKTENPMDSIIKKFALLSDAE